jgi:regulator of protease activity HflC (stomatin/prohibitin superfamily)
MIDAAECMEMSRQSALEAEEARGEAEAWRRRSPGKAEFYTLAAMALTDAAEAFERAAAALRSVGTEP